MSHPFGELLKQYRRRKPGLTQQRLAHHIGYDEAVLVRMSQGKKDLMGPSGRDRVVRLIETLHDEGALHTLDEANALLATAQLPPLYGGIPIEHALIQILVPGIEPAISVSTGYSLPSPASSFIGREDELTTIAHVMQSARLVTLTGSGGTGKTRLALEVGSKQSSAFTHGACFIGLAPVRQADDVIPTIAKSLDVHGSPGTPLLDSVKRSLANKSVLLLLDNFEHVLDSAMAISELLMAAPKLKVLVTSREPLRLSGEHLYVVEPLALLSAVELFVQRAQSVKPSFNINSNTSSMVIDICRRMDCLPLAIELAAARVRQFSPAALLANLNARGSLGVLTDAPRDAPSRHRTLRNTIAWSYALLSHDEQRMLRVLGVFVGGAEVDRIALVKSGSLEDELTSDKLALSAHLQSLVDKNLVRVVEQPDGTSRYFLLELIREFVLEHLQIRGDLNATRRSHAQAFLVLARESKLAIRSHAQLKWNERLERDYPNFREALTWSFGDNGSALIGCQLVEGLTYFWFTATRYLAETHAWIMKARAVSKDNLPPSVLGDVCASVIINSHVWSFVDCVEAGREALVHYGVTQDLQGITVARYGLGRGLLALNPYDEEGLRVTHECVTLCREIGNDWIESHALHTLGYRAIDTNDLPQAEKLYGEMVEIRRRLGNVVELSIGLWQLAGVATRLLHFDRAIAYLQESAMLARQLDSPEDILHAECELGNNLRYLEDVNSAIRILETCVALARNQLPQYKLPYPLICLGKAENDRGNHDYAHALLSEAVQVMQSLKGLSYLYPDALDSFAVVEMMRGDAKRSARLWGAGDAFWQANTTPRSPASMREYAPYIAKARAALGDAAYEAAYAEGRAMTLEQAIDFALDNS